MPNPFGEFEARLRRIEANRPRPGKAVLFAKFTRADPTRSGTQRRRFKVPLRGVILLCTSMVVIKASLIAATGLASYQDRLSERSSDSVSRRVLAAALYPDPVSRWVADQIRPVLR